MKARQVFERLRHAPNLKITMTEYVCIHDHIVLCIFSSCNRSGVNANMTLKEFEEASFS